MCKWIEFVAFLANIATIISFIPIVLAAAIFIKKQKKIKIHSKALITNPQSIDEKLPQYQIHCSIVILNLVDYEIKLRQFSITLNQMLWTKYVILFPLNYKEISKALLPSGGCETVEFILQLDTLLCTFDDFVQKIKLNFYRRCLIKVSKNLLYHDIINYFFKNLQIVICTSHGNFIHNINIPKMVSKSTKQWIQNNDIQNDTIFQNVTYAKNIFNRTIKLKLIGILDKYLR